MVRQAIARASYAVVTAPHFLLVAVIKLTDYRPVMSDYEKCIAQVNALTALTGQQARIGDLLVHALELAEDHRNRFHYGIDQIGMLRALKFKLVTGSSQGASTIAQQLVRTITGRYEKTSRRKIREQVLAIMLSFYTSKRTLSECYVNCAYYGYMLQGYSGWQAISAANKSDAEQMIIAHLKYPYPKYASAELTDRYQRRVRHITRLLASHMDKSLS